MGKYVSSYGDENPVNESSEIPTPFLTAETLRSRRNLVVISATIIAFHILRLNVNDIEIFGINFANIPQKTFLWVLFAVSIYETLCFVIRACGDYASWQNATLKRSLGRSTIGSSDEDRPYSIEELIDNSGRYPDVFERTQCDIDKILKTKSELDFDYLQCALWLYYKYKNRKLKFMRFQKLQFYLIELGIPFVLFFTALLIVIGYYPEAFRILLIQP